jgi:hypothetical protein
VYVTTKVSQAKLLLPIRQLWDEVLARQKEDVTGLWYCINELVLNPGQLKPSLAETWGLG